ncbi:MAG: 3'-5' exonuclease [Eubacteriales bacterium]
MLTAEEGARLIALRRQIIEFRFRQLNPPQREGVMTTGGPLLLLAGAGSGKTTVLIERISNLLSFGAGSDSDLVPDYLTSRDLEILEGYVRGEATLEEDILRICRVNPVQPWNILAITFTNKASRELKDRLARKLGASAEDVWAHTFHSACIRILRRDIEKLGLEKNFTIYDTADSLTVMKQCMKELEISDKEFHPRGFLGEISRAKDQELLAKDYALMAEESGEQYSIMTAKVYKKYQKKLWDAAALDFDDLLLHTVRLLANHPEVLAYYHEKFHYVLIDEYQDTNQIQYRFASLLAGGRGNFCVVGDDDQSIYRFRGATIENILNFEEQYKKCKVIRLEENYRSTKTILEASNQVIANNRGRKGKALWTSAEQGEDIVHYIAENERDEANYIIQTMQEAVSLGGSWRDHAILYRTNAQSNQLEQACKVSGVPYRLVGGTRFFDRAEVKDMLAYLTVLYNPDDDLRLGRILNKPTRGIGPKTQEMAETIAIERGTSLFSVIDNVNQYPELEKHGNKLSKFTGMIGELAVLADEMPLAEFYPVLLEKSGYLDMLKKKDDIENQTRLENVQELSSSIQAYVEGCDAENPPTLAGFLDEIALFTNLDTHDESSEYVTMMTMHAAKGLEFPQVYLPGMEEGIFPGIRSIGDEAELEEERRLCYVGMTRAKKRLYLCSAVHRMLYGQTKYNRTSRFVEEIPSELLAQSGQVRGGVSHESSGEMAETFTTEKKSKSKFALGGVPSSAAPVNLDFNLGDKVKHNAFGVGEITGKKATGGDFMVTLDFETVGKKNFLLKTASAHMKKI